MKETRFFFSYNNVMVNKDNGKKLYGGNLLKINLFMDAILDFIYSTQT